jgi:hypothetical protein
VTGTRPGGAAMIGTLPLLALLAAGCLHLDKEAFSCSDKGGCPSGFHCTDAGQCLSQIPFVAVGDGPPSDSAADLLPPEAGTDGSAQAPDVPDDGSAEPPDTPPLPLGEPGAYCQTDGECQSGICAAHENVCCNKRCDGACQFCGSDGQCQLTVGPPKLDHPACEGDRSGTCAGQCDGKSEDCQYPAGDCEGTPSCTCPVAVFASCTQTTHQCMRGTCQSVRQSCAGYACNGSACGTTCASDLECSGRYTCQNVCLDVNLDHHRCCQLP